MRKARTLPLFRAFTLEDIQEQVNFLWIRSVSPPVSSLSYNVSREVCEYLRCLKPILASVYKDKLRVKTQTDACREFDLQESFQGAITARITAAEIVCVGSYPASAAMSSIDFLRVTITREDSMLRKRNAPGVIAVGNFVYVFGGYDGETDTASCEKFAISQRRWSQLPDMDKPHCYFSPVRHANAILLVSCDQLSRRVERFNIDEETFESLSMAVPFPYGNGISAVVNDCFVLVTEGQAWTWEIASGQCATWDVRGRNCGISFSGSEVNVVEGRMLWMDYVSRKVTTFSFREMELEVE